MLRLWWLCTVYDSLKIWLREGPGLTIKQDWVIPMTKEVEIDYLLQRLDPVPCSNGSAGNA
jgi:hypothetical protein